ncbi:MAG: tRNA (guanosine(37)-N1)-methyltransferase TrmD [Candidatus Paceibacterota bacterium]
MKRKVRFDILTLFPGLVEPYFADSILKRAIDKKLIEVKAHNIRDFAKNKHRQVDEKPFGGGAGMVMMFEPIAATVAFCRRATARRKNAKVRTILFSTRGKKFTNKEAKRLSKYDQLIFICGRYEGVDERVAQAVADEEISIGDFVLTGGELPAMVCIDAIARQVPSVLGKAESLEENQGSYPTYTRPEVVEWVNKRGTKKKLTVPAVLRSGDHKKIAAWRDEYRA